MTSGRERGAMTHDDLVDVPAEDAGERPFRTSHVVDNHVPEQARGPEAPVAPVQLADELERSAHVGAHVENEIRGDEKLSRPIVKDVLVQEAGSLELQAVDLAIPGLVRAGKMAVDRAKVIFGPLPRDHGR